MSSIMISTNEYNDLKTRSDAYERMLNAAQVSFALTPPERSKKKIITAFKNTKKYSKKFLDSFEKGLARSSYFSA